jgi:hypothetical protein
MPSASPPIVLMEFAVPAGDSLEMPRLLALLWTWLGVSIVDGKMAMLFLSSFRASVGERMAKE